MILGSMKFVSNADTGQDNRTAFAAGSIIIHLEIKDIFNRKKKVWRE